MKKAFILFATLLLVASSLFGQSDPVGVQPFSTQLGNVDAATLNVHLSIPVVSKAGIGLPFSYDLLFNNNFWSTDGGYWVGVTSSTYYGWSQLGQNHLGRFVITIGGFCSGSTVNHNLIYSAFIDTGGNRHNMPSGPITVPCGFPVTITLTDGSGIRVTMASATNGVSSAMYPNGTVSTPYPNSNPTIVDTNGNTISVSGNTTTDTLGVSELTITSTSTSSTYTYPTSNSTASAVHNFGYYTVQTNFGCPGITEFSVHPNVQLINSVSLPDSSQYSFTYETTPGDTHTPHYVTGRLASVTLPTGGTIQYVYTGPNNGIHCGDGSAAGLTVTTPDGVTTYVRDATNWNQTTVTQPSGDYAVYNFTNSVSPYEVQRRSYALGGVLLLTTTTCYNGNQTNCSSVTATPALPINQIDKYTLVAGKSAQSRSTTQVDTYNNVTDVKAYDFVCTTAATPTCTSPINEMAIAYGSYTGSGCASIGNGINNHLCYQNIWDGSHTVLHSSKNYVYNSRGNTTQIQTQVSGGSMVGGGTATYLYSNFTYNANGTLATKTDSNGAVTTHHYDGGCNNGFVTSTSYPLSLSDSMTWDCNGGVPLAYTDVNGNLTTVLSYDSSWRPLSVQDQTGVVSYQFYGLGGVSAEHSLLFNGGASIKDSITYRDILGRSAQSQVKRGPSATQYNTVSHGYDATGRLNSVSVPCQVAANTNCSSGFSTITYDALNRPLVNTSASSGTVTNTYTQNDVLSVLGPAPSGEVVKQKQYEYDGLGRLASICEITTSAGNGTCAQAVSKVGYWTKYTYDALGRITQSSLNAQGTPQNRTFVYDGLGRVTSETHPETGTTTYAYDTACSTGNGNWGNSSGDLMKKTDAAGNVTCYGYDALHRLRAILYPSGPNAGNTPERHFDYDAATVNGFTMSNAKGRLAEAYTGSSSSKITDEGFSYTARGEQANFFESTPHSGTPPNNYYAVSKSYWENGALKTLGGVGLPTINYNADAMGRPTAATTSGADPLTATTYDVASRVTSLTFGSGDTANFTFNNNSGLMTSYKETINGSVVSGALTWAANGTLQQNIIVDPFNAANAQTCTYDYNDMARIKAISCNNTPSPWSQTFTYDAFGNLTKSGSLSWQPGYNAANNRYALGGTSYDANGNLLTDTFHTYTWDTENKAKTIDSTILIYDVFGHEVEKQSGGTNTEFVPKLASMNGQTQLNAFVLLPGGAKARYVGGSISGYLVPDWMGSMRIGSKAARAYDFSLSFAPFGERYSVSGGSTYEFGTNQNNTVSDEYDADNRKVHTSQGRWLSPDPVGGMLSNPQTWNRYTYVLNNPLNLIDPTGLDCVYLNASGSSAESIDHNSNGGECWSHGGYWTDGFVGGNSWVQAFSNSNNILINSSNINGFPGFLGTTLAGSMNNGGTAFSQMFSITSSLDTILSNPYTPTNYVDPMAPSARQTLRAIANAAPTGCGGGVYYYAGREVSAGPVHGFAGAINEFDSVSGKSGGALFEVGGGEGIVGGGGMIVAANRNGTVGSEGLAFGGFGVDSPVASASVGTVGFTSGAGLYAEGFLFGRGGGFGAYLNVPTNAGCAQHK